ncbi:TPA: cell envelope integrity TolA C-terminal domain-containing protein [Enterobacter cloacae]
MKPLLLPALVAVLLAGCTNHHQPTTKHVPIAQLPVGSPSDVGTHLQLVRDALASRLYDTEQYSGKACSVHADFTADGRMDNIEIKGGDAALCQAIKHAIGSAKLPPFQSQAAFNALRSVTMDIRF